MHSAYGNRLTSLIISTYVSAFNSTHLYFRPLLSTHLSGRPLLTPRVAPVLSPDAEAAPVLGVVEHRAIVLPRHDLGGLGALGEGRV